MIETTREYSTTCKVVFIHSHDENLTKNIEEAIASCTRGCMIKLSSSDIRIDGICINNIEETSLSKKMLVTVVGSVDAKYEKSKKII